MHPALVAIILICITIGAMCIGHQFPEWLRLRGNAAAVSIPHSMNVISSIGFGLMAIGVTALIIAR